VADFGLAKRTKGRSDLTLTGSTVGTPAYMSPEQAEGKNDQVATASDLFSLGSLFFHLLTGRQPFTGLSLARVMEAISKQEVQFTTREMKEVGPGLAAICLKCLEKKTDQRYGSVADFEKDLVSWESGAPLEARPAGVLKQVFYFLKKFRFRILTSLSGVTLLGVINSELILKVQDLAEELLDQWQANEYTYDFDLGLDDWVNVQASENGVHAFASDLGQSDIRAEYSGDGFLTAAGFLEHRDFVHPFALWARSPEFSISETEPFQIAFGLTGGANGVAPENDQDPRLTAPSTIDGWMGLALRRVSDGAFLLTARRDVVRN